jgi:TRAP transporter TAXI family solute receptor
MKSIAGRQFICLAALLVASLAQSVHAQSAKAGAGAKKTWSVKSLQIASAAQGGGFHALATPLASVWEKDIGVPVVVSTSRGSNENVALLERGEVALGMVTGASQAEAWNGEGSFKKPYRNGRLMFAFYPSYGLFFTRADSSINSIKDLKGKRVGLGPSAAVWDFYMGRILSAHGLEKGRDYTPVYADWTDLATQVGDGTLDAAAALETTPAAYQLGEERGVKSLAMDSAAIDKAVADYWYYFKGSIKANSLPKGHKGGDLQTVGWMGPYMLAKQDMPDDLVYALTKSFHQHIKELNKSMNLYRWLADNEKIATMPLRNVDWHPGAMKYWKEAGLWQGK